MCFIDRPHDDTCSVVQDVFHSRRPLAETCVAMDSDVFFIVIANLLRLA